MRPGELVLVPRGEGHRLRSAAGVAAPDIRSIPHPMIDDRYALLRHGGGGRPDPDGLRGGPLRAPGRAEPGRRCCRG